MSRNLSSGMAAAMALALLAVIPAVAGDSQGDKVVVTKPGVVFHKAGAGDVRGRAVERTVDSALESGYAPCPVCFAKEISLARTGAPTVPGGAATASFTGEAIPAPPVSTVTQPFGIRYATNVYSHARKDAIRNPYEDIYTVVPGRGEQGAYDDHH
jgi:hypothetical protein